MRKTHKWNHFWMVYYLYFSIHIPLIQSTKFEKCMEWFLWNPCSTRKRNDLRKMLVIEIWKFEPVKQKLIMKIFWKKKSRWQMSNRKPELWRDAFKAWYHFCCSVGRLEYIAQKKMSIRNLCWISHEMHHRSQSQNEIWTDWKARWMKKIKIWTECRVLKPKHISRQRMWKKM